MKHVFTLVMAPVVASVPAVAQPLAIARVMTEMLSAPSTIKLKIKFEKKLTPTFKVGFFLIKYI